MQEAVRRQYLTLIGIDTWLPRDHVDEPVVPMTAAVQPAGVPAPTAMPVAASAAVPPTALTAPATAATAATPVTTPVSASAPTSMLSPPSSDGLDELSCSLLALPDGLLLLAAHLPQAPGLSGPEHALLASIAAALAPGASLPATTEFHWPPRGVRLPTTARGGASDALVGLLAEQRRRLGLRDLLVLGEDLAQQVQPVAGRLGLKWVAVPALSAMLADAALKRACWDAAKPLRRG